MTAVDEAPDDSRQEYAWGLAPSHLVTRRQLRKLGKSPGKSLVAVMVGKVWGRRVVASLFDPARPRQACTERCTAGLHRQGHP
ncbi:hypothetical protein Ntsu_82070 [Nocardia sp. IFM 10818]